MNTELTSNSKPASKLDRCRRVLISVLLLSVSAWPSDRADHFQPTLTRDFSSLAAELVNVAWADEETLAVAADDCSVVLLTAETSRVLLPGHGECSTNGVAISEREQLVGVAGTNSAFLSSIKQDSFRQQLKGTSLALAFPDNGSLSLVKPAEVAVLRRTGHHGYAIRRSVRVPHLRASTIDSTGTQAVAIDVNGALHSWDLADAIRESCTVPGAGFTHRLVIDQGEVYFSIRENGVSRVFLIDSHCKRSLLAELAGEEVSSIATSTELLAISSRLGTLRIIDRRTGNPAHECKVGLSAAALAFSPSGKKLALVLSDNRVEIWTVEKK